jgi:hypothetical protein
MVSPARRAEVIDALRRGTVPQAGLDLFAVGMDRFERAIDEELDGVVAGRAVFKAVRGELVATFTAPPEFTVLHGREEVGRVDPVLLIDRVEGPRLLLLGGRSWRVTWTDWKRRRCFVESFLEGGGRALVVRRYRWPVVWARASDAGCPARCHAARRADPEGRWDTGGTAVGRDRASGR